MAYLETQLNGIIILFCTIIYVSSQGFKYKHVEVETPRSCTDCKNPEEELMNKFTAMEVKALLMLLLPIQHSDRAVTTITYTQKPGIASFQ